MDDEDEEAKVQNKSENLKDLVKNQTTKNLFELGKIIHTSELENKKGDTIAIIVGSKSSGKTALINGYIGQSQKDIKPTGAIEYYNLKKASILSSEKHCSQIFEIGGGCNKGGLFSIPFYSLKKNYVAVIVLDLSQLQSITYNLRTWIDTIHKTCKNYPSINQPNLKVLEKLDDAKQIHCLPIYKLVVCNKYDIFCKEDPEKRKWVSRALRYFCHHNGCSLIFTTSNEKTLLGIFKIFMNHMLYNSALIEKSEKEHNQPLFIPFGNDSMSSIGEPRTNKSGGISKLQSLDDIWANSLNEFYPQKKDEEVVAKNNLQARLEEDKEERIDYITSNTN